MSRVLGVDLGEILRASGRLLAVSFTMRRPEREEAPISRAGGVSFYGEHPQTIFTRRCPDGGRDGNGQLEDDDGGAGL